MADIYSRPTSYICDKCGTPVHSFLADLGNDHDCNPFDQPHHQVDMGPLWSAMDRGV